MNELTGLEIGKKYKFIHDPSILAYIGKYGAWHQFELVSEAGVVWAEILDSDLHMIERVVNDHSEVASNV